MATQAQIQQAQQGALAKLEAARVLLDAVDGLIAAATLTLETEGAYTDHGLGDVCGAVRDSIGELEGYVKDYVN